jgi:hypothetical protein
MRRLTWLLLIVIGLAVLPFAGVSPAAAGGRRCFTETGHCVENAFFAYWETHGGAEILGFPVSAPLRDDGGQIRQFFQRAILEWHPDNPAAHQVLLARLGDARLGDRPERAAPPAACDADCTRFDATNHTLRGVFARYWAARGGLAVFGYPLTEEFDEVSPTDGHTYRVQYFERNRFEHHPEHAGSRYEVLLGLLGAEALGERPDLLSRPAVRTPDYRALEPGVPERLVIPALDVNAAVTPVAVDADGNMESPRTAWETTWYAPGTRPGDPGNAVIAGHVDFRGVGPAVFWDLRTLAPGDAIWVLGANGAYRRFLVQQVAIYRLDESPVDLIFGPTAETNLNLISCAGDFDPVSRSYDQRVVVYARLDPAA